jgi:hypothetical protein
MIGNLGAQKMIRMNNSVILFVHLHSVWIDTVAVFLPLCLILKSNFVLVSSLTSWGTKFGFLVPDRVATRVSSVTDETS